VSAVAGRLFTNFTWQVWLLLHLVWVAASDNEAIVTLEQAMELWSIRDIYGWLTNVWFMPCNAKVRGSLRG
jgi:hypothetical protein